MMSTVNEIQHLLESLTGEELRQVHGFVKVLLQESKDLTEQQWEGVAQGEEEFRRDQWVKWQNVRRQDV